VHKVSWICPRCGSRLPPFQSKFGLRCNNKDCGASFPGAKAMLLQHTSQGAHVYVENVFSRLDDEMNARAVVDPSPQVLPSPLPVPSVQTQQPDESKQAAQSKKPNVPTPKLTVREDRIAAIIRRELKGLEYCHAVDAEGIRTKRTGVWKGAPATYAAAYREGGQWPHRIQDEKSKIAGKAKLAQTRKSLAGE
jgi:hypothetical protein